MVPDYITRNLEDHDMLDPFLDQPDYLKREQIHYIELAKKEETKINRILALINTLKDK
ncbi:YdeI/OmpD-associated family protein [Paenibacillus sp. IHB B 3415]|uniref:YdeI/OmpD-associated family protein n=1 Tax=Paenibacillus sp. IHB B 3415 TaxID=867080 RepID=UPI0009FB710C|nr:YdeI/OmpD-associated family protein [Paenibacillus sp. IHB B 3415]